MSANQVVAFATKRRTIYNLGKNLPMSNKEMTTLIQDVVRQCPSSHNSQGTRVVILYGAEHEKLWTLVKDAMKNKGLAGDQLQTSLAKVDNCFTAGAGTVLFYEDTDTIKELQTSFPNYAAYFSPLSEHTSAMAQYAVWTALASEGVGASLQHYNELIAPHLYDAFKVPKEWKLIAQMPFGSIEKPANAKTFIDDSKRFLVLGE